MVTADRTGGEHQPKLGQSGFSILEIWRWNFEKQFRWSCGLRSPFGGGHGGIHGSKKVRWEWWSSEGEGWIKHPEQSWNEKPHKMKAKLVWAREHEKGIGGHMTFFFWLFLISRWNKRQGLQLRGGMRRRWQFEKKEEGVNYSSLSGEVNWLRECGRSDK